MTKLLDFTDVLEECSKSSKPTVVAEWLVDTCRVDTCTAYDYSSIPAVMMLLGDRGAEYCVCLCVCVAPTPAGDQGGLAGWPPIEKSARLGDDKGRPIICLSYAYPVRTVVFDGNNHEAK